MNVNMVLVSHASSCILGDKLELWEMCRSASVDKSKNQCRCFVQFVQNEKLEPANEQPQSKDWELASL